MIQPKFAQKQGRMKSNRYRRQTNWRKHMLYGGAAVLGTGAAMLMNHQRNRDFHPDHMPEWRRPGGSGVPPYLTRPTHGPTATHEQPRT